jgi:S-adenosyl-L-methionine hydrolase (adenosine-forming)
MGAVITLTTDFGLADGYVAAMKGVILGINPEVTIVDICHNIQPQNIQQAAFILGTTYSYFPYQTIHLVVVDPGVGTNRRPIVVTTPRACFVAPDNGVLSYIIGAFNQGGAFKQGGDFATGGTRDKGVSHQAEAISGNQRIKLDSELKVYVLTKSEYWLKPVSNTFHGRDIFAPVAARLSLGMPAFSLGERVDSLTAFPVPRPTRQDRRITGIILHIDNFGNLISNIREDWSGERQSANVIIRNQRIEGIVLTYAEGQGLMALIGSSGYLEISRRNGNAAEYLNVQIGDEIKVEF